MVDSNIYNKNVDDRYKFIKDKLSCCWEGDWCVIGLQNIKKEIKKYKNFFFCSFLFCFLFVYFKGEEEVNVVVKVLLSVVSGLINIRFYVSFRGKG